MPPHCKFGPVPLNGFSLHSKHMFQGMRTTVQFDAACRADRWYMPKLVAAHGGGSERERRVHSRKTVEKDSTVIVLFVVGDDLVGGLPDVGPRG